MLEGRLKIDGKDAWTQWKVFVTDGGLNGIVSMPSLKPYESNDWHEEDGIEADLSAPVLDKKEASVSFATTGGMESFRSFTAAIEDGVYHTFSFLTIGREFKLRTVSFSGLTLLGDLWKFNVRLCDDFPLNGYEYSAPEGGIAYNSGFSVDGTDLSAYGITALAGTLAGSSLPPSVKTNLSRRVAGMPGLIYDGDGGVTRKSREIKIPCLMRNSSLSGLWGCWDALLYDLCRPGARNVACPDLGLTASCAYKSSEVDEFIAGGAWLKFTITLTVLSMSG